MKRTMLIGMGLMALVTFNLASAQEPPAGPQDRPGGPDRASRRGGGDIMMQLLDKDHDGALSHEEIAAASSALEALDKDQDGSVTREELWAGARQRAGDRPGARGDRPDRQGRGGFAMFIMRHDADSDGVVTLDEYIAGMTEQFNRIDANHDEKIDQAEAESAPMPGMQQRPDRGDRPERQRPDRPRRSQGEPDEG